MMFYNILAAVLSGLIGAMGLGGGGVLVLYLVMVLGTPQLQAQGINLLFFIPVGVVALIIHQKNGLIEWKKALPMILCGVLGIFIGMPIAEKLPDEILRKIFSVLIIVIGVKELIGAKKRCATKE